MDISDFVGVYEYTYPPPFLTRGIAELVDMTSCLRTSFEDQAIS